VHASRGPLKPASPDLRSEVAIITSIAEATLGDRYGIDWKAMRDDYTVIRRHIERTVEGCEAYHEKAHSAGGFLLPHAPRDAREFDTDSGRGEFAVSPIELLDVPPGHLLLQTMRSHDQFNTTIYGLSDRYRGIEGGRKVVFVHREDIAAFGFRPGDMVDIVSRWEADDRVRCVSGFRLVEYDTPRGSAAAYYPEANALVALDDTALGSNQPSYKSIVVTLVPEGQGSPKDDGGQDRTGADWSHKTDPEPKHLS
jgi:formate dehydrogenase major subunit